jgi:ATP-dependent Clp protease ATP-binding subunit ClpX
MKKNMKKNQPITCVCCEIPVDPEKSFAFSLNDEALYFCDSHALPFKMGAQIGQIEINHKLLSYIDDMPDEVSKDEILSYIWQLAPISKTRSIIKSASKSKNIDYKYNTPRELYDELSKTVIGQDLAKKSAAVAMINHLKMIQADHSEVGSVGKHHVLYLGKSGSGKTLIVKTVAKFFDLPFIAGDATNYSPSGYQGQDADSVISDLLVGTDLDFDTAERGIVFIDEIDKIISTFKNGVHGSLSGATQASLLKLIEGKIVKVPGQLFGDLPGNTFSISTNRMLFFFGGAFNGLSDIVAKKMGLKNRTVGFKKSDETKNKEIDEALKSYEIFSMATREQIVDSLIEYGMLSELVGRIPTISPLKPLSKIELTKVLTESNASPLKSQKELFLMSGYQLEFTDDYLECVVTEAYNSATGTRALDSYVKQSLGVASFELLNLQNHSALKGCVTIGKNCLTNPDEYVVEGLITHV